MVFSLSFHLYTGPGELMIGAVEKSAFVCVANVAVSILFPLDVHQGVGSLVVIVGCLVIINTDTWFFIVFLLLFHLSTTHLSLYISLYHLSVCLSKRGSH